MVMFKYNKTTDVQRTWKEHGWTPPSQDPKINEKWLFYRTLNTEHSGHDIPNKVGTDVFGGGKND